MTLRHSRKRSQRQWPRRDQTVMSPQSRNVHAALASLSIICGTTAVPPRLQHIRRGRCRERRFRHPSIGTNFHPDFVRTTSQSGTCCIGFHLSNKILGRAFSKFVSNYRKSSRWTLIIEDSVGGVTADVAAGMQVVGLPRKLTSATIIVSDS